MRRFLYNKKYMQKSHRGSVLLGVLIVICVSVLFWGWTPADFSNPNCKFTQNAAWVSVDWTSQPVDKIAVRQLAESAKSRNLKYLFPYVSYLKSDGSFSLSYQYANEFISTFRKSNKDARILAWIGLPLANNRPIGVQGWVNLSKQETREQIVQFIADLVKQSNFDGIHINAETVQNNDLYFLNLLDEVRQNIGKDKIISIAGSHWVPDYVNILPIIRDFRWTSSYYQEVGQRVKQIATMTYDSYTFHPALYRLWMREQVKGISSSLENSDVGLFIGISVSQEKTLSHRPAVESLANGLAGLCAGITNSKTVQGVAIYADWEFADSEEQLWQAWQR
jgi:Glycosyl hydrolases family 18